MLGATHMNPTAVSQLLTDSAHLLQCGSIPPTLQVLCRVLAVECDLRMPPVLHEATWREQFDRLWRLRFTWQGVAGAMPRGDEGDDAEAAGESYNITVIARLCPHRALDDATRDGEASNVSERTVVTVSHLVSIQPRMFLLCHGNENEK